MEESNVHARDPAVPWAPDHHGNVTAVFVSHETCDEDEYGEGHKDVVVVRTAPSARMVFGVGLVVALLRLLLLLLLLLAIRRSVDGATSAGGDRVIFGSLLQERSTFSVGLCAGGLDEDVEQRLVSEISFDARDLLGNIHALENLAEDDVLAVQAQLRVHANEELTAAGVEAGVSDTDSAELVMGEEEVLVLEAAVQRAKLLRVGVLWGRSALLAVYAMAAHVVYVTGLNDKARDDSVEERMRLLVDGSQSLEIFHGFRDNGAKETDYDGPEGPGLDGLLGEPLVDVEVKQVGDGRVLALVDGNDVGVRVLCIDPGGGQQLHGAERPQTPQQ